MNRFITFEGGEGSGKSTQIRLAAQLLHDHGIAAILTQEPSGTALGRKIGSILFDRGHGSMCAETEVLLFFAARAQHVREIIAPALAENKVVLCDRFADATFAYQGSGRGLDMRMLSLLNDYSAQNLKPDLTLLFDLPVEAGLARARRRDEQLENPALADRFEREEINFHNRVREGYLRLYHDDPDRFRLIDASGDVEAVRKRVSDHLLQFLNRSAAAR